MHKSCFSVKIDDYTCIPSTLQRILIGHLLLCEIQDLYKYSQQPIFLLPPWIVLVFNDLESRDIVLHDGKEIK